MSRPVIVSATSTRSLGGCFTTGTGTLLSGNIEVRRMGKVGALFSISPTGNSCGIGFKRRRFVGCFGRFLHPRLMRVLFW